MHTFKSDELFMYTAAVMALPALVIWTVKAYRKSKRNTNPIVADIHPDDRILLWQTIYQQTSESLREQAKLLASTNFAALAGGIALYTSDKAKVINVGELRTSLVCFGLGLILALLPISGIAEKMRDDLAEVMAALAEPQVAKVTIRHSWPTGWRALTSAIPLSLLGAGIYLFISAIKLPA